MIQPFNYSNTHKTHQKNGHHFPKSKSKRSQKLNEGHILLISAWLIHRSSGVKQDRKFGAKQIRQVGKIHNCLQDTNHYYRDCRMRRCIERVACACAARGVDELAVASCFKRLALSLMTRCGSRLYQRFDSKAPNYLSLVFVISQAPIENTANTNKIRTTVVLIYYIF